MYSGIPAALYGAVIIMGMTTAAISAGSSDRQPGDHGRMVAGILPSGPPPGGNARSPGGAYPSAGPPLQ